MSEELERKYLGVHRDTLRPLLQALGATPCHGAHFEANTVYDRDGELYARLELLRLRTREWPDHADVRLTFKRPLPDLVLATGTAKRREETELGLEDAQKMDLILQALGYRPVGRYEKVRESWTLGAASIDMDELPFGHFVEIEAPEADLVRVEAALHLDKCPASAKSYHVLHQEWLAGHHLPARTSFVFTDERRAELRAALGLVR